MSHKLSWFDRGKLDELLSDAGVEKPRHERHAQADEGPSIRPRFSSSRGIDGMVRDTFRPVARRAAGDDVEAPLSRPTLTPPAAPWQEAPWQEAPWQTANGLEESPVSSSTTVASERTDSSATPFQPPTDNNVPERADAYVRWLTEELYAERAFVVDHEGLLIAGEGDGGSGALCATLGEALRNSGMQDSSGGQLLLHELGRCRHIWWVPSSRGRVFAGTVWAVTPREAVSRLLWHGLRKVFGVVSTRPMG